MSEDLARPAVILLVEDDPGDQELTRRALTGDVFHSDLRIVSDGEEALEFLGRTGRYAPPADAPRPDIVLLDLNMPKMEGREVLRWMKLDAQLRRIPVVILTTSRQERDIARSYDLGAHSFVTKPVDADSFVNVIRRLGTYWFELVTLPERQEAAC